MGVSAGPSAGSIPQTAAAASQPQAAGAGAGAGAGAEGSAEANGSGLLKAQRAAARQGTINKAERYGLKGLLNVIRMTDPDLNTLALGTDLTTLGLNLNSTEVLYATFAYPTMDVPTRREAEYVLPYCYYMQPPALKTSHLSKFKVETLFYIFYSMPKDTLQVFAAKELYNRGWRYHKELKLWFTRDDGKGTAGAGAAAAAAQPGAYWYFDVNLWDRRQFRDVSMIPGGLRFLDEAEVAAL